MVKRWQVDGYRYCVGSYNMIATPHLDFVPAKYQYAYYFNTAVNTEWESQAIESWKEHNLFLDDLKGYQESHNVLKNVNKIIVQASHDTGAC